MTNCHLKHHWRFKPLLEQQQQPLGNVWRRWWWQWQTFVGENISDCALLRCLCGCVAAIAAASGAMSLLLLVDLHRVGTQFIFGKHQMAAKDYVSYFINPPVGHMWFSFYLAFSLSTPWSLAAPIQQRRNGITQCQVSCWPLFCFSFTSSKFAFVFVHSSVKAFSPCMLYAIGWLWHCCSV